MAYPTGAEIVAAVPNGTATATEAEAGALVARWRNRLKFAPTDEPQQALAESIVELGAHGDLLRRVLLRGGHYETPSADAMKKEANDALKEYNASYPAPEAAAPASVFNISEESLC